MLVLLAMSCVFDIKCVLAVINIIYLVFLGYEAHAYMGLFFVMFVVMT